MSEKAMRSHNGNGSLRRRSHILLNRLELVRLRQKALRRGIWYRILNRIERSLVDLAIATVSKIRSWTLARSLTFVIKKLSCIIGTSVRSQIQTVGLPLAEKLSKIAQNWGNKSAVKWATDLGFARFLAICNVDAPG